MSFLLWYRVLERYARQMPTMQCDLLMAFSAASEMRKVKWLRALEREHASCKWTRVTMATDYRNSQFQALAIFLIPLWSLWDTAPWNAPLSGSWLETHHQNVHKDVLAPLASPTFASSLIPNKIDIIFTYSTYMHYFWHIALTRTERYHNMIYVYIRSLVVLMYINIRQWSNIHKCPSRLYPYDGRFQLQAWKQGLIKKSEKTCFENAPGKNVKK